MGSNPQLSLDFGQKPEVFTLAASHAEKGSFYSGSKELFGMMGSLPPWRLTDNRQPKKKQEMGWFRLIMITFFVAFYVLCSFFVMDGPFFLLSTFLWCFDTFFFATLNFDEWSECTADFLVFPLSLDSFQSQDRTAFKCDREGNPCVNLSLFLSFFFLTLR